MGIKKLIDTAANTITFDFGDGTKEVFELSKVSPETSIRLALHGASQKIGDSYASAGKSPDPLAYAKQASRETVAQLYAGDWEVRGQGEGIKRASDLATALHLVSKDQGKERSVEAWTAYLAKKTDEEKAGIKAQKAVQAKILQIQAERAAERAKAAAEAAAKAQSSAGEAPAEGQPAVDETLPDIEETVTQEANAPAQS